MNDELGPAGNKGPDDSGLRERHFDCDKKKNYIEFVSILILFGLVNLIALFVAWHSPLDCEPDCQNITELED